MPVIAILGCATAVSSRQSSLLSDRDGTLPNPLAGLNTKLAANVDYNFLNASDILISFHTSEMLFFIVFCTFYGIFWFI